MKNRNPLQYLVIIFKGIFMGAADVVPGVSGGTIAFISGIYEELLDAISNLNFKALKIAKQEGIRAMWKYINGSFLLALATGILISLFTISKLIAWLMENEPIALWAFFFGLVTASIFYIGNKIKKWNGISIILFLLSASIAFYTTTLDVTEANNQTPLFLFFAGLFAICATVLPGISGAFLLLLLGAYKPIIEALHTKDFKILAIVGFGAIAGLITFSRLLKWLFYKYNNTMLLILTGFIAGSLNKIWPWKSIQRIATENGASVIQRELNVLPVNYEGNPQLWIAVSFFLVGVASIFILEIIAKRITK